MQAFLQLLAEKKLSIGPLITHRFPIERAQSAYELIAGKSGDAFLGVVIQYSGAGDESPTLHLVPLPEIDQRQSPASSTREISVGLLGAGAFAASTLLPAMKSSGEATLSGVCAATGAHAQHAASAFGFRYCTTDAAQLVRDPNINTVVIATRHHLHANQVLAAIGEGKHVFCEKPLCLSEDELRSIVRAYQGIPAPQRSALMLGFNRRFAPMMMRLKSFLAQTSEPLALNYRINAGYLAPDHWVNDPEQGGGRIRGEVCHFVDALMFLAAAPIVEVDARALANAGRYSGDNVLASIRFANGSEGTITYLANGDRTFSKERLEVFGGGAVAVLEDFRRLELARNGRKQIIRSRWRQDKGHCAEWSAFTASIWKGRDSAIPFEEIVCSTLATLRIHESVATGKRLEVDAGAFIDAALDPSRPNG